MMGIHPVVLGWILPFRVLSLTFERGKIAKIEAVANPSRLRELDLAVLSN
jgi:hypothetical protein